jgi:hypothetical protein
MTNYDNATCESFMKTLKYEEAYRQEYRDLADARAGIERFLEKVYNGKRLHSALGYRPPAEFELLLLTAPIPTTPQQVKKRERPQNAFFQACGIYRSDVSSLLFNPGLFNPGPRPAFRSGRCQGIGHAGKNMPCPIVRDEFRPAIPRRVARQHCPSALHRHHQHKTIAASKNMTYHRTVNSL